jgi:hypothetical protein
MSTVPLTERVINLPEAKIVDVDENGNKTPLMHSPG